MPKLRNSKTDLGAFAQWIGRKVRNHNPLQELHYTKTARKRKPDQYFSVRAASVRIIGEDVIVCRSAGRTFTITVAEVEDPAVALTLMKTSVEVGA